MCGRYTLRDEDGQLIRRYDDREEYVRLPPPAPFPIFPRYNIAPMQLVPIVTQRPEGRELGLARWGFAPHLTKDRPGQKRLAPFNARAESIAISGLFKTALRRYRCLVPADGFYEWLKAGTQKIPHYFQVRGGELFSFAGIYAMNEEEEPCVAIITTTPNELVAQVHDRMPVILPRELEHHWLTWDDGDLTAVLSCLAPYPADAMQVHAVGPLVSNWRNDGPELIEPFPGAQ